MSKDSPRWSRAAVAASRSRRFGGQLLGGLLVAHGRRLGGPGDTPGQRFL